MLRQVRERPGNFSKCLTPSWVCKNTKYAQKRQFWFNLMLLSQGPPSRPLLLRRGDWPGRQVLREARVRGRDGLRVPLRVRGKGTNLNQKAQKKVAGFLKKGSWDCPRRSARRRRKERRRDTKELFLLDIVFVCLFGFVFVKNFQKLDFHHIRQIGR